MHGRPCSLGGPLRRDWQEPGLRHADAGCYAGEGRSCTKRGWMTGIVVTESMAAPRNIAVAPTLSAIAPAVTGPSTLPPATAISAAVKLRAAICGNSRSDQKARTPLIIITYAPCKPADSSTPGQDVGASAMRPNDSAEAARRARRRADRPTAPLTRPVASPTRPTVPKQRNRIAGEVPAGTSGRPPECSILSAAKLK